MGQIIKSINTMLTKEQIAELRKLIDSWGNAKVEYDISMSKARVAEKEKELEVAANELNEFIDNLYVFKDIHGPCSQ